MVSLNNDEIKYLKSIVNNHLNQMENMVLFDEDAQKKSIDMAKSIMKKIAKNGSSNEQYLSDSLELDKSLIMDEIHFLRKGTLVGKLKVKSPLILD